MADNEGPQGSKRDRSSSDPANPGSTSPPSKKPAFSDEEGSGTKDIKVDTMISRGINDILTNPLPVFAGQPSRFTASSSDALRSDQPASDIVLSDEVSSSPPVSIIRLQDKDSQSNPSQTLPESSPPERIPTFKEKPVELPLEVRGDLAVEASPTVTHEQEFGRLICHEKHAHASSVLLFENPHELKPLSSTFSSPGVGIKLDNFIEFLQHCVANCAVCQITGDDPYHHLPQCPKAGSLGTFIWKDEAIKNYMDEAVATICALVRILAPHHLNDVALWMDEDIPGSYIDYRRWCLLPSPFFGVPSFKGYTVVLALQTLWDDRIIETNWPFPP